MLSLLMVSTVKYPSFKGLSWRTKRTIPWFLVAVFLIGVVVYAHKIMPAVIFIGYLFYGLARPWISRKWQREIEEDPDEPEDDEDHQASAPPKVL
jgi:CDP-diacylglycerol--serine O-phosphatidyltransferase